MLYLRYWWDLLQAANLLRQVKSKAEVCAVSWKLSVRFVWICSKWSWLFITFWISSTGTPRIDANLIPPWKLPVPKSDCDAKGHIYHQMVLVIITDTLPAFQWKLSLYSDFLCFSPEIVNSTFLPWLHHSEVSVCLFGAQFLESNYQTCLHCRVGEKQDYESLK